MTNQHLSGEIERLKENREESEALTNLETERDEISREKYSLEQENIAINSRLKNKVSELNEKEKELTRIKEEFKEKEQVKQKKINELDKKYKDKVKQLDEEQSEANKLEDKITQLENEVSAKQTKIVELETERANSTKPPMPGEWDIKGGGEWEKELKEQHQLELAQIVRQLVPEEELPAEITLESVLELAKKQEQPPIFSKQRRKNKK